MLTPPQRRSPERALIIGLLGALAAAVTVWLIVYGLLANHEHETRRVEPPRTMVDCAGWASETVTDQEGEFWMPDRDASRSDFGPRSEPSEFERQAYCTVLFAHPWAKPPLCSAHILTGDQSVNVQVIAREDMLTIEVVPGELVRFVCVER